MRELTDEEISKLYTEMLDHLNLLADAKQLKRDAGAEFNKEIKYHTEMAERIRQQINSGYAEPEQGELPK
jgi:hypothetical protein